MGQMPPPTSRLLVSGKGRVGIYPANTVALALVFGISSTFLVEHSCEDIPVRYHQKHSNRSDLDTPSM